MCVCWRRWKAGHPACQGTAGDVACVEQEHLHLRSATDEIVPSPRSFIAWSSFNVAFAACCCGYNQRYARWECTRQAGSETYCSEPEKERKRCIQIYIIIYIHTTNDTAKVARRNEEHCKTGVHCLQIDQPYRIFAFFADSDFVFEFLEAKSKSKKKLMV